MSTDHCVPAGSVSEPTALEYFWEIIQEGAIWYERHQDRNIPVRTLTSMEASEINVLLREKRRFDTVSHLILLRHELPMSVIKDIVGRSHTLLQAVAWELLQNHQLSAQGRHDLIWELLGGKDHQGKAMQAAGLATAREVSILWQLRRSCSYTTGRNVEKFMRRGKNALLLPEAAQEIFASLLEEGAPKERLTIEQIDTYLMCARSI